MLDGVRQGRGVLVVLALLGLGLPLGDYWTYTFALINIYIIASTAQAYLIADAHQISFGQGVVFGVGAYTAAYCANHFSFPWPLWVLVGCLGGLLTGALFAVPALRVSGFYLGFVTLATALVFPDVTTELKGLTGGVSGMAALSEGLARTVVGPVQLIHVLCAVGSAASLLFFSWLRSSGLGLRIRAAGDSAEAAQSMGLRPGTYRAVAFVVCGAATGIAGSLYLGLIGYVGPDAFSMDLSLFFVLAVIIGGISERTGPMFGVIILYLIANVMFEDFARHRLVLYGVVALLFMLIAREGLVPGLRRLVLRAKEVPQPHAVLREVSYALAGAGGAGAGGTRGTAPVLKVEDVTTSFGGPAVLEKVCLEVMPGEILAVVGPNGSGKTTLLNVVSGFVKPSTGRVELFGADVTRRRPEQRARAGLGRTFQTPKVLTGLSLRENVLVGAQGRRAVDPDVMGLLPDDKVDTLQHPARRTLEVSRVLASGAELVVLDEPAAGLSPQERRDLVEMLEYLRSEAGRTVIIVEHDLSLVASVADRVVVLAGGQVAGVGSPQDILSDATVRELFLGRQHA